MTAEEQAFQKTFDTWPAAGNGHRPQRRTSQGGLPTMLLPIWLLLGLVFASGSPVLAQTENPPAANPPADSVRPAAEVAEPVSPAEPAAAGGRSLNLQEMLRAGGSIGYLIVLLSLVMVALIIDHAMNIRRTSLMPPGLAEEIHRLLAERKIEPAKKRCLEFPGFLSRILYSGLDEVGVGYSAVEKSMEDAAMEQSARLFRRIEYLSVIGTIAPMLGLMGTVWGMIQAFLEFEQKANPQVSELAPGIYRALVTTLLGLGVAIPSLSAFAIFRNRIDELGAEAALLAEHVFADYRRATQTRRKSKDATSGS